MKKIVKRSLALVFVVALVLSMMVVPASAANNTVTLNVSYLNKEKCWIEAGKFSHLNLSRERIAVEIYAHALADNISYRTLQNKIGKNSNLAKLVNQHAHVVNIGGDSSAMVSLYYTMWYQIESSSNNTYYIHSRLNRKQVVDVSGNSNRNGAKIQLYKQNKTSAQQFELFWTGEGNWHNLLKKGTFKCLDVSGGRRASGVNVQLYDYNGTFAQQWRVVSDGGDYCYLQNRLGYYLDAKSGSSANGTQIWVYTLNKTNAQKWYLTHN